MYRLRFNEKQGLLDLTLYGFWTLETLHAFQADMAAAMKKYSGRFPKFPILSDSRELALMSAEVSRGFGQGVEEQSRQYGGRVAIVVASSLSKVQAQRVVGPLERHFFTDMDEARRWLLSGDP